MASAYRREVEGHHIGEQALHRLRRLLNLRSLSRTRLPETMGLGIPQTLQGMPQDLQLGASVKQLDSRRRRELSIVAIDELRVRLQAIEQHPQLLLHDVPAPCLEIPVLGGH